MVIVIPVVVIPVVQIIHPVVHLVELLVQVPVLAAGQLAGLIVPFNGILQGVDLVVQSV